MVEDKAKTPPTNEELIRAEQQAAELAALFTDKVKKKYLAGQREHGGDLFTKGSVLWLLDMMEEEAIDQFVYVQVLKKRLVGA